MRGQKRPLSERAQAVGIAVATGNVSEAARQTGIAESTIRQWVDLPEFAELRERTKDQVAAEWWAMVQKAFRRSAELLDATEDPVKAATAGAIIFDKMALSTGEATARTESRSLTHDYDDNEKRRLRDFIDTLDTPGSAGAAGDPQGAGSELR